MSYYNAFSTYNAMKVSKIATLLALSGVFISACHHHQNWDSKSSADSLNNMKDAIYDSTKVSTRNLVMKVNKTDARFAVDAANSDLTEIALGRLAQRQASSPRVRDFGTMMVTDHSKANQKLKTIAAAKGIALPAAPGSENQQIKNDLASKSGTDFDHAYIKLMIKDHEEDIEAFKNALRLLKDSDLSAFDSGTLAVLQKHLDSIRKISKVVK